MRLRGNLKTQPNMSDENSDSKGTGRANARQFPNEKSIRRRTLRCGARFLGRTPRKPCHPLPNAASNMSTRK